MEMFPDVCVCSAAVLREMADIWLLIEQLAAHLSPQFLFCFFSSFFFCLFGMNGCFQLTQSLMSDHVSQTQTGDESLNVCTLESLNEFVNLVCVALSSHLYCFF